MDKDTTDLINLTINHIIRERVINFFEICGLGKPTEKELKAAVKAFKRHKRKCKVA